MTKIGASVYGPGSNITIDSINQWVPVLTLSRAELPEQTAAEDYSFVAWFTIGHLVTAAGVVDALAEVSIGNQDAPLGPAEFYSCRQPLRWGPLIGNTVPGRGVSQFLVYNRTASTSGTWNAATDDVVLWARINRLGDPVSAVVGSGFLVGHTAILAFAHRQLPALEKVAHTFRYNLGNSQTTQKSSLPAWNDGGTSTWLVFASAVHAPRALFGGGVRADELHFQYADGAARAQMFHGQRIGMGGRMPFGVANIFGPRCRYLEGGADILTDPKATDEFEIKITSNMAAAAMGELMRFEVFAIRVDDNAAEGLGGFDYQQLSEAAAVDAYNSNAIPSGTEQLEVHTFNAGNTALTDVYYQSAIDKFGGPRSGAGFSWQPFILEQTGEGNILDGLVPHHGSFSGGQGHLADAMLNHIGGKVPPGRGASVYGFLALQHDFESPWQGAGFPGTLFASTFHVLFFGWHWQNNPQNVANVIPAVPAAITIVPDRESPNVTALSALPNGASGDRLLPDVQQQIETQIERFEFDSDDQTKVTWPHFLTPRRTFRLQWSGLSQADRDTLLNFFATQTNRIWKLNVLRDVAAFIAVVNTEDPRATDRGLLHVVRLEVTELIWTS